ncbi:MAG: DNA polymerase [Candidatus Giovannonibacteria bacterium]|nr:DNA polymerase [Candidatus Giovannonibacteria bacterium]
MKTLVLLDTHALIHRAYHALPKFTSKNTGEPTGALYGLSTMLLKVVRELKPDYIVAAFDRAEPTFRHDAYDGYKAQRPEAEEDLVKQLIRARDIVEAFGIPILDAVGFEADDVLGTIVEQVKKIKDLKVIIVSGDMDVLQLVEGERVVVFTLRKGIEDTVIYDEKKVEERYGFGPRHIVDFKGLKGDPSDNIVGVKGVGEKTATDIIKQFGTIENLYKNLEKGKTGSLKEKTAELLKSHKKDAFFSKTLATIRKDAPVKFALPEKQFELNVEKLTKIFTELGFTSLTARVKNGNNRAAGQEKKITEEKEKAVKIPANAIFLMPDSESLEAISKKDWLEISKNKILISPDVKAVIKFLKKRGFPIPENFFDLSVAAWVAESTTKISALPAAADLPEIYEKLQKLTKERGVEKVLYEIEFPIIPILAEMEYQGISIDRKFLEKFKKETKQKLGDLQDRIFKAAGREFNINSPAQMGDVLESLNLFEGKIKKTKTGKISTKESELVKLRGKSPVIDLILEFRELNKLLNTYIDPILELSFKDEKIHTTLNQTGTVTGRLSSEEPNLQNIPVRSDFGARIRSAFVASTGFTFAAFDYSQIELRILAAASKDAKMIEAFKKGIDIHKFTAANINNIPMEKVTDKMRSRAKTINFGIVYGMGVRQLAQSTGMSPAEAQKFYHEYFNDFPEIKKYIEHLKNETKKNGYAETLLGRKRFFDLESIRGNGFLESQMERMAVNAVIQGTDADIVKLAMAAVHKELDPQKIRPILQIHDELLYEVADDIIKEAAPRIRRIMENAYKLAVPLSVDIKIGKSLGSLKVYE